MPWCRRNLIGCWWFNLACKLADRETISAKSSSLTIFFWTCWHISSKLNIDLWHHRWLASQGCMAHTLENEWPHFKWEVLSWSQWSWGLLFISVFKEWVRLKYFVPLSWVITGLLEKVWFYKPLKTDLAVQSWSYRWRISPGHRAELRSKDHSARRFIINLYGKPRYYFHSILQTESRIRKLTCLSSYC